MRSRVDGSAGARLRVWLERAAHVAGLAIVAWLLVESLRSRPAGAAQVVALEALPSELGRWSTAARPERVHLEVDGTIAPAHRDWLAALAGTGTQVSWNGDSASPVAAAVDVVADPDGGTRILAAAPRGATVVVSDGIGVIDSVKAGAAGARFLAHSPAPSVRVGAGSLVAHSVLRDSLGFKRILVVGRVGWEAAMVTSALEERGWEVDTRLVLSPKGDVTQGPDVQPDTARYSAVVVLDTLAKVDAARLVRYVRDGGGLVATGRAGAAPGLVPLGVGRAGRAVAAVEPFPRDSADPRRGLAVVPIRLGAESVPVEMRDTLVTIAARRVDRGRVTVVGYEDTWRWRMAGGEAAPDEHRAWWAGLVAGVAHVSRVELAGAGAADEAPLASLVERLGPSSARPEHAEAGRALSHAWLLAALATLLLLQWLSRRLRGAP